jgi:hypothetical protein
MDTGNSYKQHAIDSHAVLLEFQKSQPVNAGRLEFDSDDKILALQAADVIAWSVRRRLTGNFKNGFEPLPHLFNLDHVEQPLEEDWMIESADVLRARISQRATGPITQG